MPPPPPRPPPGPPPPPSSSSNFTAAAASAPPASRPPPASSDRSAVLQDIQKGARLRKVDRSQIKDRSAPLVANGGPANATNDSRSSSNSSQKSENNNRGNATNNTSNGTAPPMGMGGLFANGMPTLKRTGIKHDKDAPNDEPPVRQQQQQQPSQKHDAPATPVPTKPKPLQPPKNTSPPGHQLPQIPNGIVPKNHSPPAAPPPPPNGNVPNGYHQQAPKTAPPPPASRLQIPPGLLPRPASFTDLDNPRPVPTPKPNFNNQNIHSGSATVAAHRPQERKPIPSSMATMPPQKPKHPPPPLPTNPPPTRNISQTMPRPVKHQRPSLPNEHRQPDVQDYAPPPPPPPVRPPSFRAGSGVPPPPPPPPGNEMGLMNNVGSRPLPPSRPPGMLPHSGSMQSLQDGSVSSNGTMRPPKRHDSLTNVLVNDNRMAAPKMAPSPPQIPVMHSSRQTMNLVQEFESKFIFHGLHELPRPSAFSGGRKTYPSAKSSARAARPTAPAPPVHVATR